MTLEVDPEVMGIAFIVVTVGLQRPRTYEGLLGMILKTKMMYLKIIIKKVTIFFFYCYIPGLVVYSHSFILILLILKGRLNDFAKSAKYMAELRLRH